MGFCFLLLGGQVSFAQTPTQVIVAGADLQQPFGYVRVGAWNLATGNYSVIDSFPGSAARQVYIWGNYAYVCADSALMKYDLTTLQRVDEAIIPGIQRVAIYMDKVLVTKGFGISQGTNYFEVRYDANLAIRYTVPGITDDCRGLVVVGDTAYIANPGLFTRIRGDMAVLDLAGESLSRIMPMDTMGRLVQDVYAVGNKIYTYNIHQYNNPVVGYISEYDIATATFTHHRFVSALKTSAGIYNDLLYGQFGNYIGTFNVTTGNFADATLVGGVFANMALDSVNGTLYAGKTDYLTYAKLYRYDLAGVVLDSLVLTNAPTAFAVDYNVTVSNAPTIVTENDLRAYPQPVGATLQVDLRHLDSPAQKLALYDLDCHQVLAQAVKGNGIVELSTEGLPAGAYLLKVETRKGLATRRIFKTLE